MSDTSTIIKAILPSAPADLVDFYDRPPLPSYPDSRINFLDLDSASKYSKALLGWNLPSALGLWALDDANDSNPFCYITIGPCSGAIMHLHHDDSSTVDFPNLGSFVAYVHDAGKAHIDIDDMVKPENPQYDCASEIQYLVSKSNDVCDEIALFYINCSAYLPDKLVGILASHNNFFYREAVAHWLVRHPTVQHLPLAESLASDNYSQVANPGKAALEAISRVRSDL